MTSVLSVVLVRNPTVTSFLLAPSPLVFGLISCARMMFLHLSLTFKENWTGQSFPGVLPAFSTLFSNFPWLLSFMDCGVKETEGSSEVWAWLLGSMVLKLNLIWGHVSLLGGVSRAQMQIGCFAPHGMSLLLCLREDEMLSFCVLFPALY